MWLFRRVGSGFGDSELLFWRGSAGVRGVGCVVEGGGFVGVGVGEWAAGAVDVEEMGKW